MHGVLSSALGDTPSRPIEMALPAENSRDGSAKPCSTIWRGAEVTDSC